MSHHSYFYKLMDHFLDIIIQKYIIEKGHLVKKKEKEVRSQTNKAERKMHKTISFAKISIYLRPNLWF